MNQSKYLIEKSSSSNMFDRYFRKWSQNKSFKLL